MTRQYATLGPDGILTAAQRPAGGFPPSWSQDVGDQDVLAQSSAIDQIPLAILAIAGQANAGTYLLRIRAEDDTDIFEVDAAGGMEFNGAAQQVFNIQPGSSAVWQRVGANTALRIDSNETIFRRTDGSIALEIDDNNIIMPNLPTTDPGIAGALWNNLGVLMVSAG